jgi:hypothetical protein
MQTAFQIGCRALPLYSHRCSPKTYTQPQLFACLLLKTFLDLDYRGAESLLRDCKSLREMIHLRQVPDHSTLQQSVAQGSAGQPAAGRNAQGRAEAAPASVHQQVGGD